MQHLLENHEMWKCLIAAEAPEEAQEEKPNCIGSPTDPITAIREEEEEQASKEEESADDLDEREEASPMEEGIPPQSETSGENEQEPEWDSNFKLLLNQEFEHCLKMFVSFLTKLLIW